ncbi:MAG: ribosome biogenesis GTPase Der, partial [Planctomycetota bacterium]|nr:ribosome biogenesis GTPase Der [Planctomycetota bacterium]
MSIPRVAIVGRPNVGKSSLFNWMARRMIAVVDSTAGTTRDRMRHLLHEGDRYFELIDTGGMGIEDSDDLTEDIENQIRMGLAEADVLVFVVDGQAGPVPLDRLVADRLRSIDKPKLLVVNKCDSDKTANDIAEFYAFANCNLITTSVKGNHNRHGLLDAILELLPTATADETADGAIQAAEPEMKLAIVGRRNVGKSTFINALAEEERVIVSEVAGTTRDSIDLRIDVDGKTIIAIDTPGVRKRKSLANDIEFYGLVRAQRSIRRADVVLMFFDSQKTISRVDKQLVDEILSNYKPCIFVVNKWDEAIAAGMTIQSWSDYLVREFASIRHAPVAFVTATESRNVRKLINLAQAVYKQSITRVGTGRLNRVVREAILKNRPPMRKSRIPKIYYAVQVGTQPPTIVLKCNDPMLFDNSWKRYLLGVLQEELPFSEVPIKLYMRAKTAEEERFPNRFLEGV